MNDDDTGETHLLWPKSTSVTDFFKNNRCNPAGLLFSLKKQCTCDSSLTLNLNLNLNKHYRIVLGNVASPLI